MQQTRTVSESKHVRAGFVSSEGLRSLLERLHKAGAGAWREDMEAAELMRYTIDRYGALARKHHLEPEDAATAAYHAMLAESTRTAKDPWAVVTTAVRITLIAEERAAGLLTSTDRARRAEVSMFHDCMRFSDREHDLADYHPALQVHGVDAELEPPSQEARASRVSEGAVALLTVLGWREDVARTSVDYVCARLIETGDRHAAYDGLRKDKTARVRLDLSHQRWIGLLRFLLGHPTSPSMLPRLGVMARMLVGDSMEDLLADKTLIGYVAATRRAYLLGGAR